MTSPFPAPSLASGRSTVVRRGFALVMSSLLFAGCTDSPVDPLEHTPALRSMHASDVDCDVTEDLRSTIDALEADGTLNAGRATALRSKLDQADRWEAEGDSEKAAEALQRLIEQIEAWVAEGALSAEDAADLLACAEDVADGPDLDFAAVSAGGTHTCGVTTTGDAYCWGESRTGQLGDNGANATGSTTPFPVFGGLTFASISAGGEHTCGVSTAGAAYCWGFNIHGQLGDGTDLTRSIPVVVVEPTFATISAGRYHTCGATTEGDAHCWGRNLDGQLGDGTNTDSDVPVAVAGDFSFSSVSAGGTHVGGITCGVTTAGSAHCWGDNDFGQLGEGTNTDSNIPVAIAAAGGLTFATISAGAEHACGVTAAGDAYCWGENDSGQLGDGTNTDSNIPRAVAGAAELTFATISAGGLHLSAQYTCGLITAGAAYCWGDNDFGQLGDGTNTDSNVPVPVAGGLTFASISAGAQHACGVTTAGDAYCWGFNRFGTLGNGTIASSNTPVAVISP